MKVISVKYFSTVSDFEQWQVQYENDNMVAPQIISIQTMPLSMEGAASATGKFGGHVEFATIVQYWKDMQ